jgi:iron complex outermembrane receptor protein
LALFQQTRDNVATPDPNNPLYSIQTSQQRARGFETDLV